MIIEKTNIVVAESAREERILHDVLGAFYPVHRGIKSQPQIPGVFYPTATFHATDEQLAKVHEELAKTDEQRVQEFQTARLLHNLNPNTDIFKGA